MIRKACRAGSKAVALTGGMLAALMVAVASNVNLDNRPTAAQTAVAVVFVLVCTAAVSGVLWAVGGRKSRNIR